MQVLGNVGSGATRFEAASAQANISVRPNQEEGWLGNLHARQFLIVYRVTRDCAGAEELALAKHAIGDRRLTDQNQVKLQIAEFLKKVLWRPIGRELKPQPWEAIALLWSSFRQAIQRFG